MQSYQVNRDRNNSSKDNSLSDFALKATTLQLQANASKQNRQAILLQESANDYTKSKSNKTGLPDNLKFGIEQLSGYAMDDVKVHYNSSKPAQLQAHAFAQGNSIYLAPKQEKHLAHEAWHVIQQKQGRVKPTIQLQGGYKVNDDVKLEKEADIMGYKAMNVSNMNKLNVINKEITTSIYQRQVPQELRSEKKEVPVTVYEARGGKDIAFDKEKHPRSKFNFGAHTRNEVFKRYNPQYVGNKIVNIRSSTGEQVNVEGIQLDHQTSWDTISNIMDAHNKELGDKWTPKDGYSLYDAKMYYNDIDNLVPALGGINASAGALGVDEVPRIHEGLEIYQGNLQTAWMNLQAGLVAVGHGITDDNAIKIADMLQNITNAMNDATDEIL